MRISRGQWASERESRENVNGVFGEPIQDSWVNQDVSH